MKNALSSVDVLQVIRVLRGAAAAACSEADPALLEIAQAMQELVEALEHQLHEQRARGQSVHARLICLGERVTYLRRRIWAESCLIHDNPAHAQMAASLLECLPWPAWLRHGDEDGPLALDPIPEQAQQALLSAALCIWQAASTEPEKSAVDALGLSQSILGVLLAREQAQQALALHDDDAQSDRDLIGEAAELIARFRAYVRVATGKLGSRGDDPVRRQRLLAPLQVLPLAPLPGRGRPAMGSDGGSRNRFVPRN